MWKKCSKLRAGVNIHHPPPHPLFDYTAGLYCTVLGRRKGAEGNEGTCAICSTEHVLYVCVCG